MSDGLKPLLSRLSQGQSLTEDEAEQFFTACLGGEASPVQVAAAVTAMRVRGETLEEIAAGARTLRRSALALDHGLAVIDTCGTGGDGLHTLNISTAAAIVAAGGGLKVAKHGTRALSSRSGSSDVLQALGVNIEASPAQSLRALEEAGICFLYAPAHHSAMRHVLAIRAELGFRTVFNLLGPLSNPAGAQRQVLGVYDARLVAPLAQVLGALGSARAWVVHGSGLDELTTTGPTSIAEWRNGRVVQFEIAPEPLGLARVGIEAIRGGDPAENALALRELLDGRAGAYRDIVLLNAAAAFVVAGRVETLQQGLALGREALDSGRARQALDRLVAITASPSPQAEP